MNIVKIIYKNGLYYYDGANSDQMAFIGQLLATDVGCRYPYREKTVFRDWALADKKDPNSGFGYYIGADATCLEEDEDGFIYLAMEFEHEISESTHLKISRQQLVQLLDDCQEKVCERKPKAKEIVVKDINGKFVIETKD